MKNFLKSLLTFALVFLAVMAVMKWGVKKIPTAKEHAAITILTQDNFQQEIANGTILVDFWADWCAPCKVMAPILNEVAKETQNTSKRVAKLDIDAYPSVASQYKIENIPTVIIFKDGIEQERLIGVKTKGAILRQLEKY